MLIFTSLSENLNIKEIQTSSDHTQNSCLIYYLLSYRRERWGVLNCFRPSQTPCRHMKKCHHINKALTMPINKDNTKYGENTNVTEEDSNSIRY